MTTTASRPQVRAAAAARRRRMRLRRTAVAAVLLVLAGAVLARRLEAPGTTTAATALAAVRGGTSGLPGADPVAAADPAAGRPVPTGTTGPGAPTSSAPASVAPTAVAPTAVAPTAVAPTSSAPARADDDGPAPSADARPSGAAVPASGTGVVTPVAVPAGPVATTGRTVRYSVEVEGGLPVDPAEVARTVMTVLTDPRGWQTEDHVRFVAVSPGELAAGAAVDIRVTLASPSLTARLCAPLDVTLQQVSCWNGSRSVLNLTRWLVGATTYGGDLGRYRTYLVSHEVGHGLGHGHVHCPGAGRPAPVMVQQTKTLEGCTAQPWPTGT